MLGVRWSDPSLGEQLGSIADTFRGVGEAPPNVSVVVGESSGRSRVKHHLYVQGVPFVVSADDSRLIRATIRVPRRWRSAFPPAFHRSTRLWYSAPTATLSPSIAGCRASSSASSRGCGAPEPESSTSRRFQSWKARTRSGSPTQRPSSVSGAKNCRITGHSAPRMTTCVGSSRESRRSSSSTAPTLTRSPDALAAVAPIAASMKRRLATTDVRALLPLVERADVVAVQPDTRHALRSVLGI